MNLFNIMQMEFYASLAIQSLAHILGVFIHKTKNTSLNWDFSSYKALSECGVYVGV